MKSCIKRIEFWIIIFFLIRLVGITNPPLEKGHNWRQVTGLMVARNFLETDANIFYPRVDETDGKSGIIGMEFPSLNYLYYLVSNTFGYTHWYGRLINLIISSVGIYFFYQLIILAGFTKRHAFISAILLLVSVWFSFSRKMMPDTYCIALMFVGLYYGLRYLNDGKFYQILLYIALTSLAVLSKIPAGIYFAVILPFLLIRSNPLTHKITIAVSTIIPLSLTYIWYFVWNPKLSESFGTWYNAGKPIVAGFTEIVQNPGKTLDNFYFDSFSGFIIFAIFLTGFVIMIYRKETKLILAFTLPFAVFLIYMFKSGYYFYHHNYYIIPIVPAMALVAAYALSLIRTKWIYMLILLSGAGESIANQQHDFFIKESEKYKLDLEQIMDQFSNRNDLIAINGNGNPQMIYLSHRKGWNCTDEQLMSSSFVKSIIDKNCKFIVINKHHNSDLIELKQMFKFEYENKDFLILNCNPVQ